MNGEQKRFWAMLSAACQIWSAIKQKSLTKTKTRLFSKKPLASINCRGSDIMGESHTLSRAGRCGRRDRRRARRWTWEAGWDRPQMRQIHQSVIFSYKLSVFVLWLQKNTRESSRMHFPRDHFQTCSWEILGASPRQWLKTTTKTKGLVFLLSPEVRSVVFQTFWERKRQIFRPHDMNQAHEHEENSQFEFQSSRSAALNVDFQFLLLTAASCFNPYARRPRISKTAVASEYNTIKYFWFGVRYSPNTKNNTWCGGILFGMVGEGLGLTGLGDGPLGARHHNQEKEQDAGFCRSWHSEEQKWRS